jgi:hypothetical protein
LLSRLGFCPFIELHIWQAKRRTPRAIKDSDAGIAPIAAVSLRGLAPWKRTSLRITRGTKIRYKLAEISPFLPASGDLANVLPIIVPCPCGHALVRPMIVSMAFIGYAANIIGTPNQDEAYDKLLTALLVRV